MLCCIKYLDIPITVVYYNAIHTYSPDRSGNIDDFPGWGEPGGSVIAYNGQDHFYGTLPLPETTTTTIRSITTTTITGSRSTTSTTTTTSSSTGSDTKVPTTTTTTSTTSTYTTLCLPSATWQHIAAVLGKPIPNCASLVQVGCFKVHILTFKYPIFQVVCFLYYSLSEMSPFHTPLIGISAVWWSLQSGGLPYSVKQSLTCRTNFRLYHGCFL